MLSLVTATTETTTTKECKDLTNKVRESRFIKIRDRKINKFKH